MRAVRDARWCLVPPLGERGREVALVATNTIGCLRHEFMRKVHAEAAGLLGQRKTIAQEKSRAN